MALASSAAELLFRARGDTDDARKEFRRLQDEAGGSLRSIKNESNTASVAIGSFLGNLGSSIVTEFTAQLTRGAKAVFDYSARMEQTKIGFTTLMGGADQAAKHLKDLQKFAQATPFEFESLAVASRRLQNVGLEAAKVIPLMRDIGNAAAAAGASSAELDSISLAFSQIIAKGKLSAEEVNQLAERGIPVWRLLEEQLGKTKGEIIKLAEQGKISSDQFLDAFQKYSQLKFGDAMEKQSHTFSGAMSTIKDITLSVADEGFKPLFNEISAFADAMAKNGTQAEQWGKAVNQATQNVIDGLRGMNTEASKDGGLWDFIKYSLDQFDYYLRNVNLLTKAYADWAESMREAGAQLRTLQQGAPNASGVVMKLDPVTNTLVPADQGTTQQPTSPVKPPVAAVDTAAIEKAQKERDEILEKQRAGELGQLAALQKAEEHVLERVTEALRAQLEARQITSKQFLAQRLVDEENFAKGAIENIDKEFQLKLQQGHLNADQQLALEYETDNERQKIVDERFKREEEAKKEAQAADKKLSEEQLADYKAAMDRRIDLSENELDKRTAAVLEEAGLEKRTAFEVATYKQFVEKENLENRKRELEKYLKLLPKGGKEALDVENQIKVLEEKIEAARIKHRTADSERNKQWNKEIDEGIEKLQEIINKMREQDAITERRIAAAARKQFEDETAEQTGPLTGGFLGELGGANGVDLLSVFGGQDQMLSEAEFIKNVWSDLNSHIGGAIGNMVQGLGQMAAAWIATGKFSAKAALQMASSVALSLAMQAGVAAIMEVARGWAESAAAAASFAVGDFAGGALHSAAATMHFSAAAVYGTVAGVAGAVGVGLGLASRAFKDESSGAFGSSGSSSSNSRSSRNTSGQGGYYSSHGDDITVIESGVNQATPVSKVIVDIRPTEAFIVETIVENVNNNGKLRTTIQDA